MGKLNARHRTTGQDVPPRQFVESTRASPKPQPKKPGTELINLSARFKTRDIYLPSAEEVLLQMHGDDVLQGRVVDISDNGTPDGVFAVIEVPGLTGPIVVSTNKLLANQTPSA